MKRNSAYVLMFIASLFTAIQAYPVPVFNYSYHHGQFTVNSDRPIDPAIDIVLDDAQRRLSTSSLLQETDHFRIFICNSRWRLSFFAFNSGLGGATIYPTRNVFIRESDIAANKVVSPGTTPLLDENSRPLSYFIAHEATHVLELRHFGLITMLRSPRWLVEGYADHVAKAGDFDAAGNRELLRNGDPLLSEETASRGLYRRYQLMVDKALNTPGSTIDALFTNPPTEDVV